MKTASLSASLLVSKGAATPSLPREILDPANYADLENVRLPQVAKLPKQLLRSGVKRPSTQSLNTRATNKSVEKVDDNGQNAGPRISTTVRLSGDTHKRLRLLAARDRVNLQVLLQQATADLLDRELGEDDCVCTGDK
jgi:hypothetical protein